MSPTQKGLKTQFIGAHGLMTVLQVGPVKKPLNIILPTGNLSLHYRLPDPP